MQRVARQRRWVGSLLHDTVRNNLLWAAPHANEADLKRALALASADDFVSRLPRGLDMIVGDRGASLSGGERQRLALARALLRAPSLLILDEATSAIDAENESRIQRTGVYQRARFRDDLDRRREVHCARARDERRSWSYWARSRERGGKVFAITAAQRSNLPYEASKTWIGWPNGSSIARP